MIVCDTNNKDCMSQQCKNCPGDDLIANFLVGEFEDLNLNARNAMQRNYFCSHNG